MCVCVCKLLHIHSRSLHHHCTPPLVKLKKSFQIIRGLFFDQAFPASKLYVETGEWLHLYRDIWVEVFNFLFMLTVHYHDYGS